jgi:uncharacterized protein
VRFLLTRLSIRHPRATVAATGLVTLVLLALAVVPSVWPGAVPGLRGVTVDTDPENMLSEDEAARVFHRRMKETFALYDMVVVGVVNEEHPEGVFNPASLSRIYELAEYARSLKGAALGVDDPRAGVVDAELLALSTVDNIEQAGSIGETGTVRFEWLMPEPPRTEAEALAVRAKAQRLPLLDGTLVSHDGKAACLYLPLTSKDLSYQVYTRLRERIGRFEGSERYYITGLPVAEDTFGVEMFVQMGVSAPLAMLVIFVLMFFFFRKLSLIVAPMVLAMITVICTMALLVISGKTIHIMSSMIPIFLMPIAVLDSIHVLSELFDRYPKVGNRRKAIEEVMDTLFAPMLFTSLTSVAGFASLAFTPIPPVRVFGAFVAIGIALAWLLTMTLIPAYVMLLRETSLASFGARGGAAGEPASPSILERGLAWMGGLTFRRAKAILVLSVVAVAVAGWGISRIQINDNPTKWFRSSHPIRQADRALNEHFAGTYMAFLALVPGGELPQGPGGESRLVPTAPGAEAGAPALPEGLSDLSESEPGLPAGLGGEAVEAVATAAGSVAGPVAEVELFKEPEVLRYMEGLQRDLLSTGVVGKSSSIADIVKTVHRELRGGGEAEFRIPETAAGVAQTLVQYQSSHRPGDLWHFVTPDYRLSSLWLQLKSGDNKDMERVVEAVAAYAAENPPPEDLEPRWFGLTYINVIWQDKMVTGMLEAFLGSFVVVLIMMVLLLRSFRLALLSMIPLTLTIGLLYGLIGIVGKDYDMPVAVLSSLSLGLAVDFAIHFLARARALYAEHGSWQVTYPHVFGEPARAIARNVAVIAVGFTPLLASPLVPYNTVGLLLAAILVVSGLATLLILPAFLRQFEPRFAASLGRRAQ